MALVASLGLSALGAPEPAGAAAGDPDPAFSGDGRVAIIPPSDGSFVARAVAIQPDGRIVVAGFSCAPVDGGDGTCLTGGGSSFRLARLTTDGGLDPEFGNGGSVTTPIGSRSQAFDVLVTADGGIVAGGLSRAGDHDEFALARYDARGALVDTSSVAVGTGFAAVSALAPGPDGTIYAAGQAVDAGGRSQMAVARVTAAGDLDPTWGDGGVTLGGPPYGYALGLAVAADGSLTTAGIGGASQAPSGYRFGVLRLTGAGTLDGGFAGRGWTTFAPGTSDSFANALVGTAGGGWLAAGAATGADNRQAMALLRGTAAGGLDPSWGTGGTVLLGAGDGAVANDVVALGDGRFAAIGQVASGGGWQFATARLSAVGILDPAFGGGVTTVAFDGYAVARATAGAVDAQGRLVTVGIGCVASNRVDCAGGRAVLLAARQQADPPAPAPTPAPSATPAPTPRPAAPAPRKAKLHVRRVPDRISRRTLARRGLRVEVRTTRKVRTTARLIGVRRRHGHRRFTMARARVRRYQRSFPLRLKPGRRATRAARAGRLRLVLRARTATGARTTRTFTIRLR